VFCIFVLFLLIYISCFFSICVQVYWPLPAGTNPTAVHIYKVVQIWPGHTVTCSQTNRPGHICTTLYHIVTYRIIKRNGINHTKLTKSPWPLTVPQHTDSGELWYNNRRTYGSVSTVLYGKKFDTATRQSSVVSKCSQSGIHLEHIAMVLQAFRMSRNQTAICCVEQNSHYFTQLSFAAANKLAFSTEH
jgi:hypothetical protein